MEHIDSMTDISFTRQFSINPCIPFHILDAYDINE